MKTRPLTPKQQRFVEEYLVDLNATQAAIRAGYSQRNADKIGSQLLGKARVAEAVAAGQAKRAARVEIDQDKVLRDWVELAYADPRELVEYRRSCCRHCHGVAHGYQLTMAERVKLGRKTLEIGDVIKEHGDVAFGGIGFDPRKDPHQDCPECWGAGVERVYVHDTRNLSPAAQRLYAGVKETKDGIQVLMADREAARVNIAKHLGMFTDRVQVAGDAHAPLLVELTHRIVDPAT